jgi:8-oxo-dGTP pyrophosphatase MutT (NUDIX family)
MPCPELLDDVRDRVQRFPRDTPEDRFEAWAWLRLLDDHGPELLTRHASPAHVTASGVVVTPDASETCLVLHGRAGFWVQPGGHLEPGDRSLAGAAGREVLEETGLVGDVTPTPLALSRHRAPCRPGEVDWHLDVLHLVVAGRRELRISEESSALGWFPVHHLPRPLAPELSRAVDLAVNALTAAASRDRAGATG